MKAEKVAGIVCLVGLLGVFIGVPTYFTLRESPQQQPIKEEVLFTDKDGYTIKTFIHGTRHYYVTPGPAQVASGIYTNAAKTLELEIIESKRAEDWRTKMLEDWGKKQGKAKEKIKE